jgi:hypothetical protein
MWRFWSIKKRGRINRAAGTKRPLMNSNPTRKLQTADSERSHCRKKNDQCDADGGYKHAVSEVYTHTSLFPRINEVLIFPHRGETERIRKEFNA